MESEDIRSFLNYYDAPLVDLAVKRANLTEKEWEVIFYHGKEGETFERTAEILECCVTTAKTRYKTAEKKLDLCWSGMPWVNTLVRSSKIPQ